jgi:DMSO/TMAO reductase YedYZ heme-binding membrane subunit
MLTALVTLGLLLAYPRGTVLRTLPRDVLIRVHIGLATFTLVFTVLHVVVLAFDKYAGVGWAGVFLPLGATYRPIPVTLGWIALYGGLLAGVTARLAGRLGRVWWPIHRVAVVTYAAAWLHGVLAGTDSAALAFLYGSSLLIVVSVATSRYLTEPTRRRAEVSTR